MQAILVKQMAGNVNSYRLMGDKLPKNYTLSYQNCLEVEVNSGQAKEIKVEIVMECPQCKDWVWISDCRKNCNKRFIQPKLDEWGNLILKLRI